MQILKFFSVLFLGSLLLIGCSDEDENATFLDISSYQQPLGSSARDLLTDATYTDLTIEMVAVQGYEPTMAAIEEFKKFLEIHLQKPGGITIRQRSLSSPGLTKFSIEDIQNIEVAQRTLFTTKDRITVFIFIADGSFIEDSESDATLGTAYLSTSLVIYGETLRKLSKHSDAPRLSTIEAAALNHEFAHLLGLVNTKDQASLNEKKGIADGHCAVKGCLMEATIQFKSGMMDVLGKGVPQLDPTCLSALEKIKNARD